MSVKQEFKIENYNAEKPFASFLPGIAGLRGKPMWAFYVNRGQCMASFGTRNKDGAIMEFYPADAAQRRTPLEGFRTFIKIKDEKNIYEPFRPQKPGNRQTLYVSPHEFSIEEVSKRRALITEVVYFTIPDEDFPALARILRVKNTSPRKRSLEIIDGMPKICPFGMNEFFMKHMSRTIEAWMEITGLVNKAPLYKLRVDASDVSQVKYIKGGNFYLSVTDRNENPQIIVDPKIVFGNFADLSYPGMFAGDRFDIPPRQRDKNFTPSAFSYCKFQIPAKDERFLFSMAGYASSEAKLKKIKKSVNAGFFEKKRIQNKSEVEKVSSSVSIFSGIEILDGYASQTNLDNILRGGYPVSTGKGNGVIYVFNRKHGDLERDYNDFVLEPEFYSQGNGNFRDINQNRRNSVWINPSVGTKDIKDFYNLIQLNGFNPLVIKPARAGEVSAEHREGYWIDHWTYNLDLLESYLALFPEDSEKLLFGNKGFMFFDNPYRVRPRKLRYVKDERGNLRQYNCVYLDEEKKSLIDSRKFRKTWARTEGGKGAIYKCTLAAKIMSIIINKTASLDCSGRGIEMEADRPGWCDSLNGLPGIMGSSLCEAVELLRLIEFFAKTLEPCDKAAINLPAEISNFLDGLLKELEKNQQSFSARANGIYWKNSNALKEKYREKIRFGINGREKKVKREKIARFLSLCAKKLENGIKKSKNPEGIPHTYFINDVRRFTSRPLPLFLEGTVHVLKTEKDKKRALRLYKGIRKSKLYDKKLGMYKLNAPIASEPLEIGRIRVFPPGWLENESIWLHMEYKYLLEVLRSGLYDEFYNDFKAVLIPFQDAARYGRSIFENSSFLVSSGYYDKGLHGTGFVARFTGATSEFLTMLRIMNLGESPFLLSEGSVIFKPAPLLHKMLFTEKARTIAFDFGKTKKNINIPKNSYAFSLFEHTLVVYSNPKRKNTYGANRVKPVQFTVLNKDGRKETFKSDHLKKPISTGIREGRVAIIHILLG